MELACLDFLNSDWRDHRGGGRREDRLRDPEWLRQFLARWDLAIDAPAGPAALAALAALRALLWRMTEAVANGHDPANADLAELNRFLARSPSTRQVVREADSYRIDDAPRRKDWNWVVAEVARSFAEVLARRDPHRLKMCLNPDCRWVFYDDSKSRTRQWCADVCGNLLKVRRHRERQRATRRRSAHITKRAT